LASISIFPIVPLTILVVVASGLDLRTRRIPNPLLIIGLVIALAWRGSLAGWAELVEGLIGFAIGLALLMPGWLLRFTGGGDVKLFAVVGAFVGSPVIFFAFAISMLVGAAFAVAFSVYAWVARGAESPATRYGLMLTTLLATGRAWYIRPGEDEAVGHRFPLAPAIALGSVSAALWFS
jgi:prepilin peptidase CpaA